MKKGLAKYSIVFLVMCTLLVGFIAVPPAEAAASIGFRNSEIQILSPSLNNQSYEGTMVIEGTSSLTTVWFYVKSPQNIGTLYSVDVKDGKFAYTLYLRFGTGKYTVWAGNNNRSFDGSIRFEVTNTDQEDTRYLAPSCYVDSDNPAIVALAQAITAPIDANAAPLTNMQKVIAIHDWVSSNVTYDYASYLSGQRIQHKASEVMVSKTGLCGDYSVLVAALSRAVGIPAKVVYGTALDNMNVAQSHAWTEVMVDGQWIHVDATWDAGYIQNGVFVASLSYKYFNTDANLLSLTHTNNLITSL